MADNTNNIYVSPAVKFNTYQEGTIGSALVFSLDNDSDVIAFTKDGKKVGGDVVVRAQVTINGELQEVKTNDKGEDGIGLTSPFGRIDEATNTVRYTYEWVSAEKAWKLTIKNVPAGFTEGVFTFDYNGVKEQFKLRAIESEVDYNLIFDKTLINRSNISDDGGTIKLQIQKTESGKTPVFITQQSKLPYSSNTIIQTTEKDLKAILSLPGDNIAWDLVNKAWIITYDSSTPPFTCTLTGSNDMVWDTEDIEFVENGQDSSVWQIYLDNEEDTIVYTKDGKKIGEDTIVNIKLLLNDESMVLEGQKLQITLPNGTILNSTNSFTDTNGEWKDKISFKGTGSKNGTLTITGVPTNFEKGSILISYTVNDTTTLSKQFHIKTTTSNVDYNLVIDETLVNISEVKTDASGLVSIPIKIYETTPEGITNILTKPNDISGKGIDVWIEDGDPYRRKYLTSNDLNWKVQFTPSSAIQPINLYLCNINAVDPKESDFQWDSQTITFIQNGQDGQPGEQGNGIKSITEEYLCTNTNEAPKGTEEEKWSGDFPILSESTPYVWCKETINYDVGEPKVFIRLMFKYSKDGQNGQNGENGQDGISIKEIINYYAVSQRSRNVVFLTKWTEDSVVKVRNDTTFKAYAEIKSDGKVDIIELNLPNFFDDFSEIVVEYGVVSYENSTPATWYPVSKLPNNETNKFLKARLTTTASNGEQQSAITELGKFSSIPQITNYYIRLISSFDYQWSTTPSQTTSEKKYLWNSEVIVFSDGSIQIVDPRIISTHGEKGPQGDQGIQGEPGTSPYLISLDNEYDVMSYSKDGTLVGSAVVVNAKGWTGNVQDEFASTDWTIVAPEGIIEINANGQGNYSIAFLPENTENVSEWKYHTCQLTIKSLPSEFTTGYFTFKYKELQKQFKISRITADVDYNLEFDKTIINSTKSGSQSIRVQKTQGGVTTNQPTLGFEIHEEIYEPTQLIKLVNDEEQLYMVISGASGISIGGTTLRFRYAQGQTKSVNITLSTVETITNNDTGEKEYKTIYEWDSQTISFVQDGKDGDELTEIPQTVTVYGYGLAWNKPPSIPIDGSIGAWTKDKLNGTELTSTCIEGTNYGLSVDCTLSGNAISALSFNLTNPPTNSTTVWEVLDAEGNPQSLKQQNKLKLTGNAIVQNEERKYTVKATTSVPDTVNNTTKTLKGTYELIIKNHGPYIFQCSVIETINKSTNVTTYSDWGTPELIEAFYGSIDPSTRATFLKLTAGGTLKGTYQENGKLYFNADYIHSGALSVGDVDAPIFSADVSQGKVSIGGWTVTQTELFSTYAAEGTTRAVGMSSTIDASDIAFYAGAWYDSINGVYDKADANFRVTRAGILTCAKAYINGTFDGTGTIKSGELGTGNYGGWIIGDGIIKPTTGSVGLVGSGIGVSSSTPSGTSTTADLGFVRIFANQTAEKSLVSNNNYAELQRDNVAKFYVTNTGFLYCNNAYIIGTVYADNGYFKGDITATNANLSGELVINDYLQFNKSHTTAVDNQQMGLRKTNRGSISRFNSSHFTSFAKGNISSEITFTIKVPDGGTWIPTSQDRLDVIITDTGGNIEEYTITNIETQGEQTSGYLNAKGDITPTLSLDIDRISVSTNNLIYEITIFNSTDFEFGGGLIPSKDITFCLGSKEQQWAGIYVREVVNTSDKNKKELIEVLNKEQNFYDEIVPVMYSFKDDNQGKYHFGFFAQDIEQILLKAFPIGQSGMISKDFDNKNYGLNYNEFIALNTWQIQLLKPRMIAVEEEIISLKSEIAELRQAIENLQNNENSDII